MRGRTTVRAIALLGAGSLGIHQLRYAIGYGDAAPHALTTHGHGYLSVAMPIVMVLALVALAAALTRLARGGRSDPVRASLPLLWLGASLALGLIFSTQETLEGAGALAGGGWIGLALAVPAGLLVALAIRGADAAELRALTLPQIQVVRARDVVTTVASVHVRITGTRLGARGPPLCSSAS